MGISEFFGNIKKKRFERAVAKNKKLISNPKAVKEERVAALEYFGEIDEAEIAVPALLQRFNYSLLGCREITP